jgi:large subunit ribosomal protein L17
MRHRKSGRKLGVTASHRKALIAALSTALLKHKKIRTTVAKAKETRMFVEKMITRARRAHGVEDKAKNVHARRMVARTIKDKDVVRELFGDIAEKLATRPGGYTRIVKLGRRQGDGAEVAILELVDFQGAQPKPGKEAKEAKEAKASKAAKTKKAPKKGYTKKGSEKKEKAGALAKEAAASGT